MSNSLIYEQLEFQNEKREWGEDIFENIMAEHSPQTMKDFKPQIWKTHRRPSRINTKKKGRKKGGKMREGGKYVGGRKKTPRHINTNDGDKI